MKDVWEKVAHLAEANYGGYVDWKERFFLCPECGEPIYECDWADSDLVNGDEDFMCPVCESIIE
jgi:predicted RNA-binding Zn-ribbon protein involved in translation (DUF1610 family)